MITDYQGLDLTTESRAAAEAYSKTVRSYLAFGMDAGVHMKASLAADGEMAMTLITRGYFFHLFAIPALARKAIDAAAWPMWPSGTQRVRSWPSPMPIT